MPRAATRLGKWAIACSAALACLAGAGPARADVERVLLVAPPRGLEAAVRTALSPWPIQIAVTGAGGASPAGGRAAPGATMPGSAERARTLAAEHRAGAVVWLSDDGAGGFALWIYDAESGRATARRLTAPPPYDAPTAAAVALTVKTLLRHSSVAPAVERYGAEAVRGAGPVPRLRVDTSAALRIRRTGAGDVEPRLGVGVRVAPGRLAGLGAVGVGVRLGPGISIDEPDFTGQFSDLELGAALMARVPLRRALELWPRLGASLHVTAIDGAIPGQATRARADRVNPGLDLGAALELGLRPWLRASVTAGGSWALRRQIYLVAGDSVLTIPRLELELGAALSVSLL